MSGGRGGAKTELSIENSNSSYWMPTPFRWDFPRFYSKRSWSNCKIESYGWFSIGTLWISTPLALWKHEWDTLKGFGLDTMTLLFSLFSTIFAVFTILFTYPIQWAFAQAKCHVTCKLDYGNSIYKSSTVRGVYKLKAIWQLAHVQMACMEFNSIHAIA